MRYKFYTDENVLEAARKRVSVIYDLFDSIVVMFSGGKDSLCCVELCRQEAERRGQLPLDMVFVDEEVINDSIVETVEYYRQQPWANLVWMCPPMSANRFILGRHFEYIQWDPNRKHVRPMPDCAHIPPGGKVMFNRGMDDYIAGLFPGNVAQVLGIRASESLVRYRSVVNKLNLNYICASGTEKSKICKPCYDWSENDVLKFIMDEELRYCEIYDAQHYSGGRLRVSTPVHAEASKRLGEVRTVDPEFYQRVIDVFPEMAVQERYWSEFDTGKIADRYAVDGWDGCRKYITDYISDGAAKKRALQRLAEFEAAARTQPIGYTPIILLQALTKGAIERRLIGNTKTGKNRKKDQKRMRALQAKVAERRRATSD